MLHSLEDVHYSFSVLNELDWSLSMFRHDYPHIGRVKSGLLRRAEFFNTLIELSIAARLKKTYHCGFTAFYQLWQIIGHKGDNAVFGSSF